jgi:hypothetical protein
MIQKASLLIAAASVLLAGCFSQVVDDRALGAGGSHGSSSTSSSGNGGNDPAVAMTRARLDQLWDEYWANHPSGSSANSGGGPALDPNDLFIRLSDLGASCGSPTAELTCGGHWQVSVALPPAYQQVGLYDLEDPSILSYSYMSETGQPNSPAPDDCSWGGGSLGSGTIEIISIDQAKVRFRLILSGGIWTSDPSGEYTAARCP